MRATMSPPAQLFAEEKHLLSVLEGVETEGGSARVKTEQLETLRRNHELVLQTLARVTRVSDITQRQLINERGKMRSELAAMLEEVSRLHARAAEQDDVLALAAHDLRSPVATIDGLAEAIEALLPVDSDPEIREMLSEIRNIADTSSALIASLMEAYRAANGHLGGSPSVTDVDALRAVIDSSWHAAAELKGISLFHSGSATSEPFLLDVHLFRRIVGNLVSNAVKYSPSGRAIEIHLEYTDGRLILEVRDEGIGISESDQKRLFQRFSGITNRPTANEPSEGVGLALVQRLLETMGGTISYRRREPVGSIFRVEIPCAPAELPEEAANA